MPILPALFKHLASSAKSFSYKTSTYHELIVRGAQTVERMVPDDNERGRAIAACEPALHRQYLKLDEGTQGPSTTVSAGLEDERTWDGEGILKTVKLDVETVRDSEIMISRLQKAAIRPS